MCRGQSGLRGGSGRAAAGIAGAADGDDVSAWTVLFVADPLEAEILMPSLLV